MDATQQANLYDKNYSCLLAAAEHMHYILMHHVEQLENQPLTENPKYTLTHLRDASKPAPPALERLCNIFSLSDFERDILLLCIAVELIPNLKSLCVKAQSDEQLTLPTFNLIRAIFPKFEWAALTPSAPLQHWQLIEVKEGETLMESTIRIDKHIFYYLIGEPSLDPQLIGIVKPLPLGATNNYSLPPSQQHIAEQIAKILIQPADTIKLPVIQLCGFDNTALHNIAVDACGFLKCNLGAISAKHLPSDPIKLQLLIRRIEREAILNNSIILLDCKDVNTDIVLIQAISQLIEDVHITLIITTGDRLPLPNQTYVTFDVPLLTKSEQISIFNHALGASAAQLNVQVETLVSQFNLSQEGIYTVVSTALGTIGTNLVEQKDTDKMAKVLWDSCRKIARPQLDDLAQRIDTKATWDDLILPEASKQTIREMINHARNRMKVYEKWGFAGRSSRGLGISVLLAGDSGTGKTMTAEVIANELGLDLYKIDSSKVVSKYIGDTEKNIGRVFNAAETGGAVLLFDEADALFSKRTEVKDSHDRNANMEINYLLQRMEAYNGLAILTTNLKDSIDSAFMRRIRFIVKYRFPEIVEREQVWRRIFPSNTPTEGLDYAKLAKLCVTGGSIRNIALNAAFLAAQQEEPVMMKHIKQAAQTEYLKLGKSLTDVETRGWPC